MFLAGPCLVAFTHTPSSSTAELFSPLFHPSSHPPFFSGYFDPKKISSSRLGFVPPGHFSLPTFISPFSVYFLLVCGT